MMALRGDTDPTPPQDNISKVGGAADLMLFIVLRVRFFVRLGTGEPARTPSEKGIAFTQILIISVTLIVVAVPEGLPLAAMLALAFVGWRSSPVIISASLWPSSQQRTFAGNPIRRSLAPRTADTTVVTTPSTPTSPIAATTTTTPLILRTSFRRIQPRLA